MKDLSFTRKCWAIAVLLFCCSTFSMAQFQHTFIAPNEAKLAKTLPINGLGSTTSVPTYISVGTVQYYPSDFQKIQLTQYNAAGIPNWSIVLGDDPFHYQANDIELAFDNAGNHNGYIITGYRSSDLNSTGVLNNAELFLMRTDLFGSPVWSGVYGMQSTANTVGVDVVVMPNGDFMAIGNRLNVGVSTTPDHLYVVRTNAGGNLIWARDYTFPFIADATATITAHAATNAYLPFIFIDPTFPSNDPDYVHNGIAITGKHATTTFTGAVINDAFVVTIGGDGQLAWYNTYHSSLESEMGHDIIQTPALDFMVIGEAGESSTSIPDHILTFQTSMTGGLNWLRLYNLHAYDMHELRATGINYSIAGSDTYVVTGYGYDFANPTDPIPVPQRAFLLEMDYNGNIFWMQTYVSPATTLLETHNVVSNNNVPGTSGKYLITCNGYSNFTQGHLIETDQIGATDPACPEEPVEADVIDAGDVITHQVEIIESDLFVLTDIPLMDYPLEIVSCLNGQLCTVTADFVQDVSGSPTVLFNDVSLGNGIITNWSWDFGDGATSTLQNPSHTYATGGIYSVCLTVTNTLADGTTCVDEVCRTIWVLLPACWATANFDYIVSANLLSVDDISTGGGTITAWNWSFGDGNTSTLQNPVHEYEACGWYEVCLTVTVTTATGATCTDTYCVEVYIGGSPCMLDPNFLVLYSIPSSNTLSFVDASTSTHPITSWYWDFGDGNTSTVANPSHTYMAPGIYVVCLTITTINECGETCEAVYCNEVVIEFPPCIATPDFSYVVAGNTVTFTDLSSGNGTIINWYWDFGDGNSATVPNPVHTYTLSGPYVVCLVIVVDTGFEVCEAVICYDIFVEEQDCKYKIRDTALSCVEEGEVVCIWLDAITPLTPGIIGLDYCLNYNPAYLTPISPVTATLGDIPLNYGSLTQPSDADYFGFIDAPNNRVHASIYYNGAYNFDASGPGSVICIQFMVVAPIPTGTSFILSECEVRESYLISQVDQCAYDGIVTVTEGGDNNGQLMYWRDASRPIDGTSNNTTDTWVEDCPQTSASIPYAVDELGCFTANSEYVQIERQIVPDNYYTPAGTCVPVMSVINGMDCACLGFVTTFSPMPPMCNGSLTGQPNPFQMVAGDVNMNDALSSGDITQIIQRILGNRCEYVQAWNYDALGNPLASYQDSKDWRFVDQKTAAQNPDFQAHGLYPNFYNLDPSDAGYWRDDVPDIPECLATCEDDTIVNCYPLPIPIPPIVIEQPSFGDYTVADGVIHYYPFEDFSGVDHISVVYEGSENTVDLSIYVNNEDIVPIDPQICWISTGINSPIQIVSYYTTTVIDCCEDKLNYHGVLLGDVNGSWFNGSGLRTESAGQVVFDMANMEQIDEQIYDIPVYYNADSDVFALDFSLAFDTEIMVVEEVISRTKANADAFNMQYRSINNELRVTSYTLSASNTTQALYTVRVRMLTEMPFAPTMLSNIQAYINGQAAEVVLTAATITGINTIAPEQSITVYPNPVLTTAHISVPNEWVNNNGILQIKDVQGKVIKTSTITQANMLIDVADLVSGLYLVTLEQNERCISTTKLLKQ